MRAIDADALQLAIVEEGQANKRKKYIIGDIWELTGAEIREVINSQPTIQPEPHWIPVAERPDKSGDYLVTLIDGAEKWVEIVYWNETFGGNWQAVIGDEEYYSTIGNVIAWMPLPEPYKEVTT